MDRSETAYFMYTLRWLKECEKDFAKKEQIGEIKEEHRNISAIYHMAYYDLWNRLTQTYGTDYTDVLESYVCDATVTNSLENALASANKLGRQREAHELVLQILMQTVT